MKKACVNIPHILPFLKILADENRLKILCFLKDWPKGVCQIADFLDLPQNLVSHHLKKLKEVWLLDSRKEWLRVFYFFNDSEILRFLDEFEKLFGK